MTTQICPGKKMMITRCALHYQFRMGKEEKKRKDLYCREGEEALANKGTNEVNFWD